MAAPGTGWLVSDSTAIARRGRIKRLKLPALPRALRGARPQAGARDR